MSVRDVARGQFAVTRAELLRAIERLRLGLPPFSATQELTVGSEAASNTIRALVADRGRSARFVLGNYGAGKSHFLATLRDAALTEGYATCWLTADGYDCALNHPQRFISALLSTLETAEGDSGYSGLLTRLLESPSTRTLVLEAAAESLDGGSNLETAARALLFKLGESEDQRDNNSTPRVHEDTLARVLSGESLTPLGNLVNYRRMAYRLLALSEKIVQIAGFKGLLVILDEVESIFTKLWNVRSRIGAYRTLSALCYGIDFGNIKLAMAITPDAARTLAAELSDEEYLIPSTSVEPIDRFASALSEGELRTFRCSPLKREQMSDLLELVREAYVHAHPETDLSASDWLDTTAAILFRMPPIRFAIRDCVDTLDRARQRSHVDLERKSRDP